MAFSSVLSTCHLLLLATGAVFLMPSSVNPQAVMEEYCNEETFKASCGPNQVIVMTAANYGRMRLGRCVKKDLGYVGCSADVVHVMDHLCSGRYECEFRIPDLDKYRQVDQTCLEELKAYLEASYTCVDVHSADKHLCQRSDHVKVSGQEGYLASIVSEETNCGTGGTPWVIEVMRGQHINITLLDFSVIDAQQIEVAPGGSQVCHAYAIIREKNSKETKTICGGARRVENVYISNSNSVEVRLFSRRGSNTPPRFLMKYEARGCADPNLGPAYKVKRHDKVMEVKCISSGETWRLVCSGKEWSGQVGNCTKGYEPSFGQVVLGNLSLSFEIAIVIITVIASLISICILIIGIICLRRKRATLPPQNVYQQRQPRKSDPYGTNRLPTPPSSHENPQLGRHDGNEYACILEMPLPPPPPGANLELAQEAAAAAAGLGDRSLYETNQREPPTLQRLQRHHYPISQQQSHLQDNGYPPPLPVFDNGREGLGMSYEEDPRYFELDPDNVNDNHCHPAPGLVDMMNQRVLEERDKHAARYSN